MVSKKSVSCRWISSVQVRELWCFYLTLFRWGHPFPERNHYPSAKVCLKFDASFITSVINFCFKESKESIKYWQNLKGKLNPYLSLKYLLFLLNSIPQLKILLINTKIPRSTKKLVGLVRERKEKVRSRENLKFISHTEQRVAFW